MRTSASIVKSAVRAFWPQRRMCSTKPVPTRVVLPTNVVAKHYRLFLEPLLSKYTYSGNVEIDLDVAAPTKSVTVNILDLVTRNVKLGGEEALGATENKDEQTITWTFPTELPKGAKTTLSVDFEGELNDKMAGFYRSVHKDDDGNTQVVAATQMEATDCRRAFPCFDEPALKATFDVSIAADPKLTVLSNSDVKSEEVRSDGKKVTHFNTTPKMSTYLVAFIVGDLRYVESQVNFRVPVRVYATPGLEKRCQFAADLAAKTLKFFEDTFGIEYPLPKCDMIGLHDFSAGAMENWGLITYRLVALFYEEGKDSIATKIRVAEVVQHELAHQWFGNLVTMEWWENLYLNEAFATWMSWYSADHFFPEWKVWETYVTTVYQSALSLDGLRSSHPIEVPVARADEISQIFDAISYMKGSCVLRMLSKYLGEDVFIKGVSLYLKRHAYGNTVAENLWQALSEVSGQDVNAFMGKWTKQVGYPVVSVKENGDNITVEQHRFLTTKDTKPEEDHLYPVWLSLRRADGSVDRETFLSDRSLTLPVDSEFYKLNADHNGIFRVLYSDERIEKLAGEGAKVASSQTRLTTEDRIGLVADVNALTGGYTRTSQLLTLVKQWRHDPEPNVWMQMLAGLSSVSGKLLFESEKLRDTYRAFRASVVVPKSKELGHTFSSSDSATETELKSSLFSQALAVRDPETIDIALREFSTHGFNVEPNIRSAIFRTVSKHGSTEQWNALLGHYTAGTNGQAGNDALVALGSTKNPELRQKLADCIIDGTVRGQDSIYAIAGLTTQPANIDFVWSWLTSNWTKLTELFPPAGTLLSGFVRYAVSNFTKPHQLEAVEKFFADKDVRGIDQSLNQSKDRVRSSILFLEKDLADIEGWLKQAKL